MNDLNDLLVPEVVLSGTVAGSKKKLFVLLGEAAASAYGLDAALVTGRLGAREKLGSTGFGGGIAIPHGKIEGLPGVRGLFIRLEKPLDFASVDESPVDLVFALLSPPEAGADHLKALSRIARVLRDPAMVAKLRASDSESAVYACLSEEQASNAA